MQCTLVRKSGFGCNSTISDRPCHVNCATITKMFAFSAAHIGIIAHNLFFKLQCEFLYPSIFERYLRFIFLAGYFANCNQFFYFIVCTLPFQFFLIIMWWKELQKLWDAFIYSSKLKQIQNLPGKGRKIHTLSTMFFAALRFIAFIVHLCQTISNYDISR